MAGLTEQKLIMGQLWMTAELQLHCQPPTDCKIFFTSETVNSNTNLCSH